MNEEIDVETAQAAAQSIAANNFDPTKIITHHTEPIVNAIKQYLNVPFLMKLAGTVIMLLIIYIIYRICRSMILRLPENKLKAQHSMMIQKTLKYIYYVCAAMYVLGLFGIKFSAIWGAAGVAGVAIGFAAQTSVSNIISGLFVLSEKAMKIGDLVTIDGVTGVVDSTDLLSVKIHTLDNQLVRVPNSTIINKNFLNTSYFPQRRMTIGVSVSYDTDMTLALETLKKAPAFCPTVLREPEPAAWFDKFGEKGIDLVLAVWFKSEDFLQTKNSAFIAIKKVYDEAGIEIPYYKLNVKMLSGGTE
ncbi:mechanosensitive ion channel family protein [Treponema parvum]|uniref:Mechanosensitive ion channel family protein n=1 Tax=Treponema parvum TaxID=138851 RepID=A0A975F5I8_9SPIR|nr:mechanosensitive ion channel family protein [Treponema parvum]QTQ15020.1 mechanosensitive ion channel family protein [Treponema parvum]